jgi:hypothetical protein
MKAFNRISTFAGKAQPKRWFLDQTRPLAISSGRVNRLSNALLQTLLAVALIFWLDALFRSIT